MLVALKLMYYLGFKNIYLLGCDFNMKHDDKKDGKGLTYSFSQYKHQGGILTNNFAYKILNARLTALQPILKEHGCNVYNCLKPNESNLTAFPFLPLDEAIDKALEWYNPNVKTQGYYGGREPRDRDWETIINITSMFF